MVMGECSAYSSLQADSKVNFAAWPTSWRPPGAERLSRRGPKVNFGLDDSSIKYSMYDLIVTSSAVGRQLVGQAANLTFESACRLL